MLNQSLQAFIEFTNLLCMTPLQKHRIRYQPILPKALGENIVFKGIGSTTSLGDEKEIEGKFPKTFGRPLLHPEKGEKPISKALKVGEVSSVPFVLSFL